MVLPVLFLLLFPLLCVPGLPTTLNEQGLPKDPIFFQKAITESRQFEDFLLSNANIGRAEVELCLNVLAPDRPRPPPPTAGPEIDGQRTDDPTATSQASSSSTNRAKQWRQQGNPSTETPEYDMTTATPHGVEEQHSWAVGSCSNNYSVQNVIEEVTAAQKFLILKITEMVDEAWPYLHKLVAKRRFIILNWPIVMGPGSDVAYMDVVDVPRRLRDVHGVLLSYREGTSTQDNEDDRYWYYHFEQMAAALESSPLKDVPIKLVAFNGLYLTRSTASDLGNCSRATGFLHYLNDKDTVRLNSHLYKRRIESYRMISRYNIWAISEYISPNFNSAGEEGDGVLWRGLWLVLVAVTGRVLVD